MSIDDELGYLAPKGTVRFALNGVCLPRSNPNSIVLVLRHTETTPAYVAARAVWQSNRTPGLANASQSVEQVRETNLVIAKLFAKHIVASWENALNADGSPKPVADVEELFGALIRRERTDLFGQIVSHAANASNFADGAVGNAELLGKG